MSDSRPHPISLRALQHFDLLFPEMGTPPKASESALNPEGVPEGQSDCSPPSGLAEEAAAILRPAKRYGTVSQEKSDGVTYTPRDLADFVGDEMMKVVRLPNDRPVRVLDPAVGHGELLHSLLTRVSGEVEVFGFETDPAALAVARARLEKAYPRVRLNLVCGSFLDHVLDHFSQGLFSHAQGYDLIIANPPYVRTQIMGAERAQALAAEFGLSGRVDLYFAFLLGMARVLAPSGSAGIIVSNRFMTTRAGGAVRAALTRELRLRAIFDLGDTKLFDAAVLPAVIVADGRAGDAASELPRFTTIYETKSKSAGRKVDSAIEALAHSGVVGLPDGRAFEVRHGVLHNDPDAGAVWRLSSGDVANWLETVDAHTWSRFRDIGKVRVGVKTCADKVFIRRNWPEPLELLRPLTTHKIARRYRPDPTACPTQILYPHEAVDGRRAVVDLEAYPASRDYLEAHRKTLEGRGYVLEAGRRWFEIWVPQNPADWEGPKLVFRDICERPTFWIDLDDTIVNGDCYWLRPKPGMVDELWLALAVANSTFIEKYYDLRFNNKLYAGRRRFITQYVEEFPLPDSALELSGQIIRLTKELYRCVDAPDVDRLEAELNALVWMSFGLSVEEV